MGRTVYLPTNLPQKSTAFEWIGKCTGRPMDPSRAFDPCLVQHPGLSASGLWMLAESFFLLPKKLNLLVGVRLEVTFSLMLV